MKSQLKQGGGGGLGQHRNAITRTCVPGLKMTGGKNKCILDKDASDRAFNFKAERRVLFLSWRARPEPDGFPDFELCPKKLEGTTVAAMSMGRTV